MALACSPALCANAEAPTYGWREYGGTLASSLTAWAMRVASRSRPVGQHRPVALELEVGDDGEEVGVAGALAVAVERALHVGGARVDGGQRVGHRAAGVVVAVDAQPADRSPRARRARRRRPRRAATRRWCRTGRRRRRRPRRRRAAPPRRTPGCCGSRRRSARRRGRPAAPRPRRCVDRVAHHREVLLERRAQSELDVPVVALGHQRHDGRPESRRAATRGSSAACAPGRRVAPNAASCACSQFQLGPARGKNSVSLGLAPGQPPSMNPTPSSSRCAAIASLSPTREREALLLGAVAQRRVVDVERVVHAVGRTGSAGCVLRHQVLHKRKRPPAVAGGLRAGRVRSAPAGALSS